MINPALLFLAAISLLLGACAHEPPPPPVSTSCLPPAELLVPSPGPAPLPKRAFTQKDTVRYWGRDRADFRKEADRHNDLSIFIMEHCK